MSADRPIGYLALVRQNRRFRYLWFGQIISLFGDWFNLIASAALVAQLTESGLAVGGLFAIRMLAPFLVSPLAGVASDRYNRKTLLILTDLARAAVVMGFLFVRQPGQVGLLYALTALQLGISGVFFPTRNAILPDLVAPNELGTANALSSATWSVMLALGAAFGGLATGMFGIYPAFAIDASTFLISAAMIGRIDYPAAGRQPAGASLRAALGEYLDGLRYLKRQPDILAITLHKAAIGLGIGGGAISVVMVHLAGHVYVIGEGGGIGLGLMMAVAGVGTGMGPILVRLVTGDQERAMRRALVLLYLLAGVGLLLAAQLLSFESVLLGMFIRAFGMGSVWVFSTQLLLQLTPERVRGRVFASEFALFTLSSAISSALGGWALDSTELGVSGLLAALSLGSLIPAALWATWVWPLGHAAGVPHARRLPESLQPAAADPVAAPAGLVAGDEAQPKA